MRTISACCLRVSLKLSEEVIESASLLYNLLPSFADRAEAEKQMRPGPATRAALLSRTFRLPSLAGAKDHRTNGTPKSALPRCSPEACASGLRFNAFILLGRGISLEAAKPGHRRTGHAPNFPR